LISLIHIEKLKQILGAVLDENEFLSPYGIRSLSKLHEKTYSVKIYDQVYSLEYAPGVSNTRIFGNNSNWRGPVWFPINYLLIRSLNAYYQYYGDALKVEFPTRSANFLNLREVAVHLKSRLVRTYRRINRGIKHLIKLLTKDSSRSMTTH
jgi:glycogen debranching enzyme